MKQLGLIETDVALLMVKSITLIYGRYASLMMESEIQYIIYLFIESV